jgi:hypothetical protein
VLGCLQNKFLNYSKSVMEKYRSEISTRYCSYCSKYNIEHLYFLY